MTFIAFMRRSFLDLAKKIKPPIIYWRLRGWSIPGSTKIYGKIYLVGNPGNLAIGKNCSLGHNVVINARDNIIICDYATISTGAQIHTGCLDLDCIEVPRRHRSSPIYIEKNAWIASNAVLSPGVRIGENSVVGANSVVTSDVPANCFYAGSPARKIRGLPFTR